MHRGEEISGDVHGPDDSRPPRCALLVSGTRPLRFFRGLQCSGGLLAVSGPDEDAPRPGPGSRLDILQRIPDHIGAVRIDPEFLRRPEEKPRRRFPAVATPEISAPALRRVVGAEVEGVDQGPFRPEHLPEARMDLVDERLVENPPGDAGLVRHDDRLHPAFVDQTDRLGGAGDQSKFLQPVEIPHLFVDRPVAVQKDRRVSFFLAPSISPSGAGEVIFARTRAISPVSQRCVLGRKNIPRPGGEVSPGHGFHGTSPRIFRAAAYTSSTPIISMQRKSVGQTGFRQGPHGTS